MKEKGKQNMELYAGLTEWTFGAAQVAASEAAASRQSTDIQALLKIAATVPQSVFDAERQATPAETLQERRPRRRPEASQRIRIVKSSTQESSRTIKRALKAFTEQQKVASPAAASGSAGVGATMAAAARTGVLRKAPAQATRKAQA